MQGVIDIRNGNAQFLGLLTVNHQLVSRRACSKEREGFCNFGAFINGAYKILQYTLKVFDIAKMSSSNSNRHGEAHRHFSAIIGWEGLKDSVQEFGEDHEFTKLVPDLKGKDPDDAFSKVPYEKGFIFLFYLENLLTKEAFDRFIPHVSEDNSDLVIVRGASIC